MDNATKNPNFVNGKWIGLINEEESSPNPRGLNPLPGDDDKSNLDPEDIKVDVEDK